jgi:hypothetical protein
MSRGRPCHWPWPLELIADQNLDDHPRALGAVHGVDVTCRGRLLELDGALLETNVDAAQELLRVVCLPFSVSGRIEWISV